MFKSIIRSLLLSVLMSVNINAVSISSTNVDGISIHGVSDSTGTLLGGSTPGRVGSFIGLSDNDISSMFTSGNLSGLDTAFTVFDTFTFDDGFPGADGYWTASLSATINDGDALDGANIFTWITDGSFTSNSDEHLIGRHTGLTFPDELTVPSSEDAFVYDTTMTLIAGAFGTYTHDFGFGEGVENIYNTAAVPEPTTYAAIFGLAAFGFVAYRRKRAA